MTNISIDDLILINLIASQGSFARAADMLNVTRSSVSRRVKVVEDSLQILLFRRTTRQLELTYEGERFIEHTLSMEQEWSRALGEIQSQKSEPTGKLTVCSLDLLNRRLAQHCLTDFIKQYPKINLTLLTTHGAPEINKFNADLMLHISPLEEQGFVSEPLVLCHRRFYASPTYLAKNGVPKHPRQLGGYATIECSEPEREREHGHWIWHEKEATHQVEINSYMQCDELEVAMYVALNDGGIAWLPDFLVREHVADGRLVALFDGNYATSLPIYAIYPKSQYSLPATLAFAHFMRYSQILGVPLPPEQEIVRR